MKSNVPKFCFYLAGVFLIVFWLPNLISFLTPPIILFEWLIECLCTLCFGITLLCRKRSVIFPITAFVITASYVFKLIRIITQDAIFWDSILFNVLLIFGWFYLLLLTISLYWDSRALSKLWPLPAGIFAVTGIVNMFYCISADLTIGRLFHTLLFLLYFAGISLACYCLASLAVQSCEN